MYCFLKAEAAAAAAEEDEEDDLCVHKIKQKKKNKTKTTLNRWEHKNIKYYLGRVRVCVSLYLKIYFINTTNKKTQNQKQKL